MKNIPRWFSQIWLRVLICCVVLFSISTNVLGNESSESIKPKILLFRVLPNIVKGEQRYEFHWEVINADVVKLYRGGREMPSRRSRKTDGKEGWPASMSGFSMKLTKTTTYELIAENLNGNSVRQQWTVRIPKRKVSIKSGGDISSQKPNIKSFSVSPAVSKPGGWIKFHWNVEDADYIRLYDDLGEIELRHDHKRNSGEMSFFSTTIDKTTTFRLEAIDKRRHVTSKSFTVRVKGSKKPQKNHSAKNCNISGKLTGKWRQEIQERANGSTSTWTVRVLIYADNANNPFANAIVSNNGNYIFKNLEAGKNYKIRPEWASSPSLRITSCDQSKREGSPSFEITGSPRID